MALTSTEALLAHMNLTKDLALEFFISFARLEYALIAANFARERDNGAVEADWNCFINSLGRIDQNDLQPVLAAGTRLIDSPPKRLVVDGQTFKFEPVVRGGQSTIRFLIEGVKRARNNLFHGGKYYTAANLPDRNTEVVSDALTVIQRLLDVPGLNYVRQAYNSPHA